MCKRIISMFIGIAAIVILVCNSGVYAEESGQTEAASINDIGEQTGCKIIAADDFNSCGDVEFSSENGQFLAGLELFYGDGYPSGISISGGEVNFGSTGKETYAFSRTAENCEFNEPFVVRFDFRQNVRDNDINSIMGFTDYTSSTNANIQLFTVENNIYAKNNGADEVVLRDYELGKVYKIKMFINPKAEEYDIYINDECRALGMKFGFNSIGRLLCFDAKKGETRWSLDNLCIYTDEREIILSAAARNAFPKGMVISSNFIEFSKGNNEYLIDWESSNSSVVDTESGVVSRDDAGSEKVIISAVVKNVNGAPFEVFAKFNAEVEKIPVLGRSYMASETFEELSKIEKNQTVGKGGFRVASCSGISIEDDNGNRVLKSEKGKSGWLYMDLISDNEPESYAVEFSFKLAEKNGDMGILYDAADGNKIGIKLTGDSDNICCLAEGEQINVIQSYETDKWYNIKLIINGKEKTFDIYSDNICKGKNLGFMNGAEKLTRLFRTEVLSCEAYFDDISVYTDSRTNQIASEDFEELFEIEKGQTVGKGGFNAVSCGGISIEETGDGKVLKSIKGSDGWLYMDLTSDRVPDSFALEFSFKLAEKNGDVGILYDAVDDNKIGIKLTGDSDNIYCLSSDGMITLISDYETDKWYNIRLFINNCSKTFDVYLDNVCKAAGLGFMNGAERLRRIFRTEVLSCDSYFDNISVYTSVDMEELFEINACGIINSSRQFPARTKNGYSISWNLTGGNSYFENNRLVRGAENERVLIKAEISTNAGEVSKTFEAIVLGGINLKLEYLENSRELLAKVYKDGIIRDFEKPVVIIAVFKDNLLIDSVFSGVSIVEDSEYQYTRYDVSKLSKGEYKAKAFIFNGFGELMPLESFKEAAFNIE